MPVCVSHLNHHQTVSCAVCSLSIHCTLPITNNTMPFCMPHTHQPITFLSQLFFLLLNVIFFIVIVLVTTERVCGCDGMHHLFAPITNTLCVCHLGAIQCGHHFALVLWLWCLLFTTPLCFTHASHLDCGCCRVAAMWLHTVVKE